MNINLIFSKLCKFIQYSLIMIFFIFIGLNVQGAIAQEEDRDEIPKDWVLVPRISVAMEYGGFAFQQYNYTSMLRRYVEIDLLQYQRHIFYLLFDEKTYFGVPGNSWEFNLMKFDAVLGGYRYDFGKFYAGLFLHHRCNNIFLTSNYHELLNRERANIYDIGLEILTKNLRVGMQDRNINFNSSDDFEFLGKFAGGFWASRAIVADRINLDWLIKARLRYDILRYKRLVPYLEVAGEAYLGPDNKIIPSVELGIRYHFSDLVDITPFFKWSRDQLALTTSFFPTQSPFITANYSLCRSQVGIPVNYQTVFKIRSLMNFNC